MPFLNKCLILALDEVEVEIQVPYNFLRAVNISPFLILKITSMVLVLLFYEDIYWSQIQFCFCLNSLFIPKFLLKFSFTPAFADTSSILCCRCYFIFRWDASDIMHHVVSVDLDRVNKGGLKLLQEKRETLQLQWVLVKLTRAKQELLKTRKNPLQLIFRFIFPL